MFLGIGLQILILDVIQTIWECYPLITGLIFFQYSNVQLKCLPKKAALTFLETFLYCNKPVYLNTDLDLIDRSNRSVYRSDRSNPNLTERLDKLTDSIF